jgi:DNA-binding NtrC family response regulator
MGLIEYVTAGAAPEGAAGGDMVEFGIAKRNAIARFEREYLTQLMTEHSGNITQAANAAGKERRDLGKLLKKHRLDPSEFKPTGS